MGIPATEVKKGMVIDLEGERWLILDFQHITPGNWRGYVQLKLRNIRTQATVQKRVRSADKIDDIFQEKKACEYLYRDGKNYVFMDTESYEQFHLDEEMLGDNVHYLTPNTPCVVTFLEEVATGIELSAAVVLEVVEAEEAIRGDTATNVKKQVVLETGHKVNVPHFIRKGDKVKVDTRSGDFIERSNA